MSDAPFLQQTNPTATVLTDLYVVPEGVLSSTLVSIFVCNQGAASAFRLSVAKAGAVDAAKQYIYYDVDLATKDTFLASMYLLLGPTDVVRVYASTSNVSFTVSGQEKM